MVTIFSGTGVFVMTKSFPGAMDDFNSSINTNTSQLCNLACWLVKRVASSSNRWYRRPFSLLLINPYFFRYYFLTFEFPYNKKVCIQWSSIPIQFKCTTVFTMVPPDWLSCNIIILFLIEKANNKKLRFCYFFY